MPTEKPRVTFTVSPETLNKIEEYRFSNKSKNQTQAILSLIEKGLSDYEPCVKKALYLLHCNHFTNDTPSLPMHDPKIILCCLNHI